ncbi:MAG: methyltransferase domain-containing protein [Anaerolineaceae bacterium]
MEFTGERFVPQLEIPEISYEHWNRYLFARQFVKDKIVLDVACGEGYGSYLLASTAQKVIGVDISQETVDFAKGKYIHENLEFLLGSAAQLPLHKNNFLDVIVSYETIEHISEKDQISFLGEVKRTLKKDGIFIVSTPNKKLYSDVPNYNNEFHIKEFYFEDFKNLLESYFKHVDLLGQRVEIGSYIGGLDDQLRTLSEDPITFTEEGFFPSMEDRDALYFVAVCSDASLIKANASFSYDKSKKLLRDKEQHINALKNQLNTLKNQVNALKNQLNSMDIQLKEQKQFSLNLKIELEQTKEEAASYAVSTSWRITRPMRKLIDLLRKIKHVR